MYYKFILKKEETIMALVVKQVETLAKSLGEGTHSLGGQSTPLTEKVMAQLFNYCGK